MATRNLPLEELKGTTVSDLFAYSGSKVVELKDWIDQQWEEVGKYPSDTFHKQGYVVQSMVEVFSKTEKKEKSKAICGLAGRLWFAHGLLYDQHEALKKEFTSLHVKFTDVEEELLAALTEKNEFDQKLLQMQRDREKDESVPKDTEGKNDKHDSEAKVQHLTDELERAKQELQICHDHIENMRTVTNGHVNSLCELQAQAHEYRRRSEGYQQRIQDLEAEQKREKPQPRSDCDGLCKDKIRQLEADNGSSKDKIKHLEAEKMNAREEIETLKADVLDAKDRYWGATNTIRDRELSIEHRDSKISRLEKERDLCKKQVEEIREEIKELQIRLPRGGNYQTISRRPSTTEVVRMRREYNSTDQDDSAGPRREGIVAPKARRDSYRDNQKRDEYTRYNPYSDDGSDSEWTEVRRRKNKNRKNERRHHDRAEAEMPPNASAKSIKALRGMLPLFSKNNKGSSILDHLALYQRLMLTLDMRSDIELKTYLSWTFATDSQSFFMSVDSKDYETWAEYRSEVIKHFSPHRNAHEALRHALNLKCESNQHPRDYLQQLKNAFAQVQKEVDTETKQFKDAFFYGLPKNIRTQLARDYNEDRSIDWIYKQAKSIYDVSRTEESPEGKDKPKPSKVCEVGREKELPFETGGNKPRPAPREREQRRSPERKAHEVPPRETEAKSNISPRYRGNNPIPNFVYRSRGNRTETRPREEREREKPQETERNERGQYGFREREKPAPDNYRPGGYDRPEYRQYRRDNYESRDWQERRNSSDNRDRYFSDSRDRYQRREERSRSPQRPNRLQALEKQLHELSQHFHERLTQSPESSSRVNAVSTGESADRDTTHTGQ